MLRSKSARSVASVSSPDAACPPSSRWCETTSSAVTGATASVRWRRLRWPPGARWSTPPRSRPRNRSSAYWKSSALAIRKSGTRRRDEGRVVVAGAAMPGMHPWYGTVLTLAGAIIRVVGRLQVVGKEKVPLTGGLVIASNHHSFWDPPTVSVSLPRETHFLAKEELFRVPGFGALIRSVNAIPIRRGMADLSGIARVLEKLRSGECLIVFPEGGRMKDGELHRAKPGLGLIVAHARVPVVPVYVSGTNHIRRCLARKERIRVRFGEPMAAETLLEDGEP